MEVVAADPPTSTHNGKTYQFCSDGCKDQFDADPEQVVGA
jgi:YHS domain-containing protein